MKYINVAMLAIIIALCWISIANSKQTVTETAYVCKSNPRKAIIGVPIESFLSNTEGAQLIETIDFNRDANRFEHVMGNVIVAYDNIEPPYPVDHVDFFESSDPKEREREPFFLAVFSYSGCLMNYSKIPVNMKETIFGRGA